MGSHPPQFLPGRIAAGQLFEFGVVDFERLRIVGEAIAVEILVGAPVRHAQNRDDPATIRRDPHGLFAFVPATGMSMLCGIIVMVLSIHDGIHRPLVGGFSR